MKFGFDVDDTLVETYPALERKAKEIFGIVLPPPKNFTVLRDNLSQNQLFDLIQYTFIEFSNLEVNTECVNFIRELIEKGIQYEIPFVTARPLELEDTTKEMIGYYLSGITSNFKLCICSDTKVDHARKEGITHYIEDRWKYAKELGDCGIKTFLKLKPWNKHSRGLYHPDIIPFRNYEYIKYKVGIK